MMGKSNHYICSIIFLILLILTGCGKKYKITPDSLPIAHVNQEYKKTIEISGGKVVDQYAELNTNIPKDFGITVQPDNDSNGYNILVVKGTPKCSGEYLITIRADFFGGGGAEIKKTYTLKVEK